jgi:hypothetical protein
MIRTQTLSLALTSVLLASVVVPAQADVAMQLNSRKTYRQNKKGDVLFRGGSFDVAVRDGRTKYGRPGGCESEYYFRPSPGCAGGTTGFVIYGEPRGDLDGPYFWFSEVVPAIIIEPRQPQYCLLQAAPPSDLPRPYSGFTDSSYGIYYNLHDSATVREYVITRYDNSRNYSAKQRDKFENEIVPGVYHYQFPRLRDPISKVSISPVIFPMAEGYAEKNNQKFGVLFNSTRWTKKGFMELSSITPNIVKWSGFNPSSTFATVDRLYFSMRYMQNQKNPLSDVTYSDPQGNNPASIFPNFLNDGDPRILLANPFVNTFTLPPIFKSGTTAVIELELDRAFRTGGVTYDLSDRKFQIPIMYVSRYSEYAELRFGKEATKLVGILDDYDGDGYNNLNEWILKSRADDSTSIPLAPIPAADPSLGFGFTVEKERATVPKVNYTLQRSINFGKTWAEFVSDSNWIVTETADEFTVESAIGGQPPGTGDDIYRVKITLAK